MSARNSQGTSVGLRWALALPQGIAMAAGDRGVIAAYSDAGAIRIGRFHAPSGGIGAALRCEEAAISASQTMLGAAPLAGRPRRSWRALALWLVGPSAGWLVAARWSDATPWALVGLGLAIRMAPWLWQVARVRARRPTPRQLLHAAEHHLADPAGLICGATMLTLAALGAAALDCAALASVRGLLPHGESTSVESLGIWPLLPTLTGGAALSGVPRLLASGLSGARRPLVRALLGPVHRAMAWARPPPTEAGLRLARAAAKALNS